MLTLKSLSQTYMENCIQSVKVVIF